MATGFAAVRERNNKEINRNGSARRKEACVPSEPPSTQPCSTGELALRWHYRVKGMPSEMLKVRRNEAFHMRSTTPELVL